MLLTVSVESLSCLTIKSLTAFSGLSVGGSGMPVKIRLSLMLRACKSRIVSFIVLFSEVTGILCFLPISIVHFHCLYV